jgi:hypothetical protein
LDYVQELAPEKIHAAHPLSGINVCEIMAGAISIFSTRAKKSARRHAKFELHSLSTVCLVHTSFLLILILWA